MELASDRDSCDCVCARVCVRVIVEFYGQLSPSRGRNAVPNCSLDGR